MSTRGERIWGLKTIAARLRVAINTVLAWSRLAEDPLPVRVRRGAWWAWAGYLDEWIARRHGEGERLEGAGEICARLGCTPRTMWRWARAGSPDRLPVHGIGTRRPWAFAGAVRDWVHRMDAPVQATRAAA